MTIDEALIILSVLKAAFPKEFPYNMSFEDAEATAIVWSEQFLYVPGAIVELAVKKIIGTEESNISIAKVKNKIGNLYWEATTKLNDEKRGLVSLSKEERSIYEYILKFAGEYRSGSGEPSISQLITSNEKILMLGSGNNDA